MARLTIRLTEQELHEIQRLAKLRELTPPQLCYQAFVRFMEIERKNPRSATEASPVLESRSEIIDRKDDSLRLKNGVTDPIEIVRKARDPEYAARVQALAAVYCHDEDSIFLPLAASLLTGLFLYLAHYTGPGWHKTIRSVHEVLSLDSQEALRAIQRMKGDESARSASYISLQKFTDRTYAEMEQVRLFALAAVNMFFEPVLGEPAEPSSLAPRFERSLTIPLSREEHLEFVNLASRLHTSPAHLGRESIQRLVGQNRPHLALVLGEQSKS